MNEKSQCVAQKGESQVRTNLHARDKRRTMQEERRIAGQISKANKVEYDRASEQATPNRKRGGKYRTGTSESRKKHGSTKRSPESCIYHATPERGNQIDRSIDK